jgi:pimeloyl-ACP methyl ester carboxylesterase
MPTLQSEGVPLHYADEGSGEPLVLIHGAVSSSRCFDAHIPALSDEFRVIVPDLRTMGRNPRTDEMAPTAWTDDLVALLDHLDLERVHLCGTSLGARIVLRLATLVPDRVASVTADAPIVADSPEGSAFLERIFGPDLAPPMAAALEHWNGPDWRTVLANYMTIRSRRDLQEHLALTDVLEDVRCPVLVTRGDIDDPIHSLAHALEVHRRVPDSRLWVAPETPFAAARFAADAFLDHLRAFVRAVGAREGHLARPR